MVPATYPSLNGSMVVAEVDATGKRPWHDYIPIAIAGGLPQPAVLAPLTSALPTGATFTRASSATYIDPETGALRTASSNVPRFERKGLLFEGARTNFLLNSGEPETQTVSLNAGTYTLSVWGAGSAEIAGEGEATQGSPLTFTLANAGDVDVVVDGELERFQLEDGAFATSYTPTTASAATRAADVLNLGDNSVVSDTAGAVYVEYTPLNGNLPVVGIVMNLGSSAVLRMTSTGPFQIGDGTNFASYTRSNVAGQTDCFAAFWETGGSKGVIVNGDAGTPNAYDGDLPRGSGLYVGNSSGGINAVFGHLRSLMIWDSAISTDALSRLTGGLARPALANNHSGYLSVTFVSSGDAWRDYIPVAFVSNPDPAKAWRTDQDGYLPVMVERIRRFG